MFISYLLSSLFFLSAITKYLLYTPSNPMYKKIPMSNNLSSIMECFLQLTTDESFLFILLWAAHFKKLIIALGVLTAAVIANTAVQGYKALKNFFGKGGKGANLMKTRRTVSGRLDRTKGLGKTEVYGFNLSPFPPAIIITSILDNSE